MVTFYDAFNTQMPVINIHYITVIMLQLKEDMISKALKTIDVQKWGSVSVNCRCLAVLRQKIHFLLECITFVTDLQVITGLLEV